MNIFTRMLKVAFMGIRGIPASYSGFETFVDQVAPRLADLGHDVTVYNRSGFMKDFFRTYKGVRMVYLPSLENKHLDTLSHSLLSVIHGWSKRFDIVYFCGVGNSPVVFLSRLGGAKVVLNVDGQDWARGKWGHFARWYLKTSEAIACRTANLLIADAKVIQERYRDLYRKETVFVPYGANIGRDDGAEHLKPFLLEPRSYFLFAGRLVPENNAHLLIEAFLQAKTAMKLVILGDAPFSEDYKRQLRSMVSADGRVVFTGYQFGAAYQQLSSHAYAYCMVSAVDGTRPVLLDQMGFGNCILVRNSPANSEVAAKAGWYFDKDDEKGDLIRQLEYLAEHPETVAQYRQKSVERVAEAYSWDKVTRDYSALFGGLLK